MNTSKQLINVLGIVVVVGIVVAGIALIALPLYSNAQATDASTRQVAQTNEIYQIQVAQLSADKDRIDEIDADVAELRREITDIPQLDDVMELVVAAAAANGATIESVTVADPEAWSPRTGLSDSEADTSAAPTETEPSGEATAADEAPADAAAAVTPPADAADSPQRQIPVTIEVTIADAAAAAAFVDALRTGPRLIAPIDATLEDGTLTVAALAFVRIGD